MAQNFEQQAERTAVRPDVGTILVGWTVYDRRDRPIGNVSDLEGGRLRIDGRAVGHGYFDLPLDTVRSAGDGRVDVSMEMEELDGGLVQPDPEPAATQPASRRVETSGTSYTASDTPMGLGSNTPVGNEPSGYREWDAQVEGSSWSRYVFWLAPVGIGAASAGLYVWWRNRESRRGRLQRAARAFAAVGGSVGSVTDAARERKQAWWLSPLLALPLAFYLRSAARDGSRLETLGSGQSPAADWKKRLSSAGPPRPETIEPPGWTIAVPIVAAAAGAAWLATRLRRRPVGGVQSGGMRRLGDIMTREVQVVSPSATVFEAASLMKRLNVGALPICDGRRLQGMVTDRDIALRTVAESRDPQLATVRDAMTSEVVYAFEDDSARRGADLMAQHKIRRLPIVDREKNLAGIVSLGDLAVDTGQDRLSGQTLERVSEPARPKL